MRYCCVTSEFCGERSKEDVSTSYNFSLQYRNSYPKNKLKFLNLCLKRLVKCARSGVHGGNNKFLEILGDRNQGVIDHDILGIYGIDMVYVYDVRFVSPIKFILG